MENVIHSTFVIVSSLATVLVDKGTSQYPKCGFDHVCFRCVFHCFQVYYVWFKSLQRGRPCFISKLGPQGLSNVCEFRRLEVESVGNDIEDVINNRKDQQNSNEHMMLGFLACSMLGLWYYDTQEMEILKSGRFRKKRRACTIWTQQQTHPCVSI